MRGSTRLRCCGGTKHSGEALEFNFASFAFFPKMIVGSECACLSSGSAGHDRFHVNCCHIIMNTDRMCL